MKQKKPSSNLFKDSSDLVTFFKDCYYKKYKRKIIVNRFKTKYYFLDVLEDHSIEEVKKLIVYYFDTVSNGSQSISDFLSRYDQFEQDIKDYNDDVKERQRLRELTRQKVERYREEQQRKGEL